MHENDDVTNCRIDGKSPEHEVIALAFFRRLEFRKLWKIIDVENTGVKFFRCRYNAAG